MKKELATWQFIKESIDRQLGVVLLYVLQSSGSSPGRAGFFMAINEYSEMMGSIGGGIMEHKFGEMAKSKLQDDVECSALFRQVHDKSSAIARSGMICSGEQLVWMYRMKTSDKDVVNQLIDSYQKLVPGILEITCSGIRFLPFHGKNYVPGLVGYKFIDTHGLASSEENTDWAYLQKTGSANHLHIIGGGHCSLALSKLMNMLDFYIHVYDERDNLNTMQANGYAQEKMIIEDFTHIDQFITAGEDIYVVVMTFGYRSDDTILRLLMQKNLLTSVALAVKENRKMFTAYRGEGIDEKHLNRIHAPIGFPIGSKTPEEIAVSIAAEIIETKNRSTSDIAEIK